MKKNSIVCIVATILFTLIMGCVDRIDISSETELVGIVVEKSTNAPLSGILVQITDGHNVYSSTTTGYDGKFSLNVNFNRINDAYYLFLDGSPNLPSKREELHGRGETKYDYGYIALYDKTDASSLPKVTTGEASNVLEHTATVNGVVSSDGGYPLTERGICYATHQSPTVSDARIAVGNSVGSYNCNLIDLQIGITYYYCAYATNSIGTSYGEQRSFTTRDGKPTVTTTTPTRNGITVTTGGNVTSDGGYTVTARGVCYGLTPNPDLSSSHTNNNGGTGSFTATFEMPTAGIYYVRAYATNANGTSYGEQKTIKHPYTELPTFTYEGQTYRVAPPAPSHYYWIGARNYCDTLTLYGYSDWRLPSRNELNAMRQAGYVSETYWSSSSCGSDQHYIVSSWSSTTCVYNTSNYYGARPIRVEN